MKLISKHNFSVMPGEQIVIRVTPVNLQMKLLVAVLDGHPLRPSNGAVEAKYSFAATKPVGGTHVCLFEAAFPPGTPPEAAYKFSVRGSSGEGEDFSLLLLELTHVIQLSFHVEDDSSDAPEGDRPIIIHGGATGIAPPKPWD